MHAYTRRQPYFDRLVLDQRLEVVPTPASLPLSSHSPQDRTHVRRTSHVKWMSCDDARYARALSSSRVLTASVVLHRPCMFCHGCFIALQVHSVQRASSVRRRILPGRLTRHRLLSSHTSSLSLVAVSLSASYLGSLQLAVRHHPSTSLFTLCDDDRLPTRTIHSFIATSLPH
jgi:hypothetical protein